MAELGAIASIVGIAAAGAQLSMALFEFGSTVGSARSEVNQIAIEISQFSPVLKQLHSTLTKAKARRYSISAIATTQEILKRCQEIFREIEDIVQPLQKSAGKSKEPPVDVVARVKWTFKRSKVQVLQKTLESSKSTLQLMLLVLDIGRKTASPRASTIEEQLEDEQGQAVIQGLITARQCTVDQLEILENEAEAQNAEQDDSIPEARSSEVEVMQIRTGNGETVISDGSAQKRSTESKRASVWVSNLIFNNNPLPSGFRRNTWGDTISAPTIASQARYLVQEWTARAPKIIKDSNQDQKRNSGPAIEDSEEEHGNDLETSHDEKGYEASDEVAIDYEDYHDEGSDDEVFDDFWIPQSTSDGRLFYFNTQTGESAMKPPKEAETVADTPKELNSPTNIWIPQSTPDGRLFYFNAQTGESAMKPIEESPKTVANFPFERADSTRNSAIDELKISLQAQTALLDQEIQSLVTSVRSDAEISTSLFSAKIDTIDSIISTFISSAETAVTSIDNKLSRTQTQPV